MVVNYYFTVFYDVWEGMTLFSQGGLWFVLERAYAKEWGSPHKNSWLKCKMLWTEHKDVLACLFHCAAPSPHRAGRAAAALALMHRAHSTGCRSHFCQESLCYFCVSSRDILAWNPKEAQERARHDMSQHPQGTGAFQHTRTNSPASSPASPLLDIPSPSHHKHRSVFWGGRGGCVGALLWSLEDTSSATGVPHGHTSRDVAGPVTVLCHNTQPCLTIMCSLLDWIWTWECMEQAHLTKKYTFREIDI